MSNHLDPDEIVVEIGRRAPFSQLGDWVALSGASAQAKALYWHLSMHINISSGETKAWPSRRMLANALGLKKTSSVDTYIQELVDLEAIDKKARKSSSGGHDTNLYLIHQTPPPGYKGPADIGQWYKSQRTATTTPSAKKGTRGSGKKGTRVAPKKGPEQDEVEQDEVEQDEERSSVASVGSSVQVRNARGGDGAPPARPGNPESSSGSPSRQAWDVFAALPPAWRKCPQWVRKLFAAEIEESLPKYGAVRIISAVTQYAPEPGDLIGAGLTREDADKHLRAFRKVLSFAHSDMLAGDSPHEDTSGAVNQDPGSLPDWLALADDACAQCGKSTDDVTMCLELPIPTPLCAPHYEQTLQELST